MINIKKFINRILYRKEIAFCQLMYTGYIARNELGQLEYFESCPKKITRIIFDSPTQVWESNLGNSFPINYDSFPFITSSDNNPLDIVEFRYYFEHHKILN